MGGGGRRGGGGLECQVQDRAEEEAYGSQVGGNGSGSKEDQRGPTRGTKET